MALVQCAATYLLRLQLLKLTTVTVSVMVIDISVFNRKIMVGPISSVEKKIADKTACPLHYISTHTSLTFTLNFLGWVGHLGTRCLNRTYPG